MNCVKRNNTNNAYSGAQQDWAFEFEQEIKEIVEDLKESFTELKEELKAEFTLIREEIKDTCKVIFDDEEGVIIF